MAALESFETLHASIPEWIERLDQVARQVVERQTEFARLAQSESLTSLEAHKLRKPKNGSTESLRPINDRTDRPTSPSAAPPPAAPPRASPTPAPFTPPALTPDNSAPDADTSNRPVTPASPPAAPTAPSPSAAAPTSATTRVPVDPASRHLFQTFREQAALARRKRKSSASSASQASGAASGGGRPPPRARTRRSLIVLYDGAVQEGLAALVRRVAGARNSLRKARLAAGAAARLARLGAAEESPFADAAGGLRLPKVPRLPRGEGKFVAEVPDPVREAVEEVDRELEAAQSLCEVAAHQFLREGGCAEELEGTRERFEACRGVAGAVVERLRKEEEAESERRGKTLDKVGANGIEIDHAATNGITAGDPLAIDGQIGGAPAVDTAEGEAAAKLNGIEIDEPKIDHPKIDEPKIDHPKIDEAQSNITSNLRTIEVAKPLRSEPFQMDIALDNGIAIDPMLPSKRPAVDAADMGIQIEPVTATGAVDIKMDSAAAVDNMIAIDNEPGDFKIDLTAFRRTRRM